MLSVFMITSLGDEAAGTPAPVATTTPEVCGDRCVRFLARFEAVLEKRTLEYTCPFSCWRECSFLRAHVQEEKNSKYSLVRDIVYHDSGVIMNVLL